MQYKTGVYSGAFDPLHIGHVKWIIEAACECEKLYVVLKYSREQDTVPMEMRYRWLVGMFRHLPGIHVVLLDKAAVHEEAAGAECEETSLTDIKTGETSGSRTDAYETEYCKAEQALILKLIGAEPDVIYCEPGQLPVLQNHPDGDASRQTAGMEISRIQITWQKVTGQIIKSAFSMRNARTAG